MNEGCLDLNKVGLEEEGRKIAQLLVERQLAACVNIVPQVESVYRWQGKVESANEWLLVIKTLEANFSRVCDGIKELHSYELPECIKLEISGGSQKYLEWIEENVKLLK